MAAEFDFDSKIHLCKFRHTFARCALRNVPSKEVGFLDVGGRVAVAAETRLVVVGRGAPQLLLVGDLAAGSRPAPTPSYPLLGLLVPVCETKRCKVENWQRRCGQRRLLFNILAG